MASEQSPVAVEDAVRTFLVYPFAEDQAYQQGLASILSAGSLDDKSDEEKESMLRQSQVYYFNRIARTSITLDDVRSFQGSPPSTSEGPDSVVTESGAVAQSNTATSTSEDKSEPRILSFAELKEMIEQGKTDQIPNNKAIPYALHDAPPSESKAPPRKKPWE